MWAPLSCKSKAEAAATKLPLPLESSVGVSSDACSLQLSTGFGRTLDHLQRGTRLPAWAPARAPSCLVELGDGFLRASAARGGKHIPPFNTGRAGPCVLAVLARPASRALPCQPHQLEASGLLHYLGIAVIVHQVLQPWMLMGMG